MTDSVRPLRQQPTRLHCPWDSPGKNTGVGCHFLLQCMGTEGQLYVNNQGRDYLSSTGPALCCRWLPRDGRAGRAGAHLRNLSITSFIIFHLIGWESLHHVMLDSAVQWSESAIYIHIAPSSWASLWPLPHPTPLGHHRAPSWAPVLHSSSLLAIYW